MRLRAPQRAGARTAGRWVSPGTGRAHGAFPPAAGSGRWQERHPQFSCRRGELVRHGLQRVRRVEHYLGRHVGVEPAVVVAHESRRPQRTFSLAHTQRGLHERIGAVEAQQRHDLPQFGSHLPVLLQVLVQQFLVRRQALGDTAVHEVEREQPCPAAHRRLDQPRAPLGAVLTTTGTLRGSELHGLDESADGYTAERAHDQAIPLERISRLPTGRSTYMSSTPKPCCQP
jgi:hypothetical protein